MVNYSFNVYLVDFFIALYLFLFGGENNLPKEQKRDKSDPKNGKSNGKL